MITDPAPAGFFIGASMAIYQIPLTPVAQRFRLQIVETLYTIRVHWADAPEGGWLFDLADDNGNDLLAGVPLVCGVDLLSQHQHLGIGVALTLTGELPPGYADLGTTSKLIFEAT